MATIGAGEPSGSVGYEGPAGVVGGATVVAGAAVVDGTAVVAGAAVVVAGISVDAETSGVDAPSVVAGAAAGTVVAGARVVTMLSGPGSTASVSSSEEPPLITTNSPATRPAPARIAKTASNLERRRPEVGGWYATGTEEGIAPTSDRDHSASSVGGAGGGSDGASIPEAAGESSGGD
jgi:hypothetical protein